MMLHAISLESTECNGAAPFGYRSYRTLWSCSFQQPSTGPDTAYKGQWVLTLAGSYRVKHFFLMRICFVLQKQYCT